MITPSEGDIQKRFGNPPSRNRSFDVFYASVIDSLSQYVKNTQHAELKWELKRKKTIVVTMIMIMVKNEWKTLLFITKYLVKLGIGK